MYEAVCISSPTITIWKVLRDKEFQAALFMGPDSKIKAHEHAKWHNGQRHYRQPEDV